MESPRTLRDNSKHVHPGFAPCSLIVDIGTQKLSVFGGNHESIEEKVYPVSTSKFGIGSEPGSYKTPVGRFFVCDMIGAGAETGAVFKGRELTGAIAEPGGEEDLVLTRILRLAGLDPHNRNTYSRYVYIHGTNQESAIGSPASHGCVRMRNADIIELFSRVQPGASVVIRL